MLDENTIRAIPTRNLLQIHAAYVATLAGTDDELRRLQDERRRIDDALAAIAERTRGIRDLATMTGQRLVEVGFSRDDLDNAVHGINGAVASTFEDHADQPAHAPSEARPRHEDRDPRPLEHGGALQGRHAQHGGDDRAAYASEPDPSQTRRPRREAGEFRDVHADQSFQGADHGDNRSAIFHQLEDLDQSDSQGVDERYLPPRSGFQVTARALERAERG